MRQRMNVAAHYLELATHFSGVMMQKPIGFVGLGVMGTPMALNMARSGRPLLVWSRSNVRYDVLRSAGAEIADLPDDVFSKCQIVMLMLANDHAIDDVLGRGTSAFKARVADRIIVNMGTTSAEYSQLLAVEIRANGGRYVEAPVSGSRKPAEAGKLVIMLAGLPEDVEKIRGLVQPLCHESFLCGDVPRALTMKLAVNLFLITMVTGLTEATHFAKRHGIDLALFTRILNAGPMSSDVSRVKLDKLATQDFSVQAAITDVLKNSRLVVEAARSAGVASPLMDICLALYGEAEVLGLGADDMSAVVKAIEKRTEGYSQ